MFSFQRSESTFRRSAVPSTMSAPGAPRRSVDLMSSARTPFHRVAFLAALRAFPAALRSLPFSSSPAPRASVPRRPDAFPDCRLTRPLSSSVLPLTRCARSPHVFSVPGDVIGRDSVLPGHVSVNAAGRSYPRCSAAEGSASPGWRVPGRSAERASMRHRRMRATSIQTGKESSRLTSR